MILPRASRSACALLSLVSLIVILRSPRLVHAEEQHLSSDAPEAWAMFFYTSVLSFSGIGTPRQREPWSVEVFADVGSVPQLSADERTVGFDGTKEEDLNKAPVFGRPGLTIGLPWKSALSIAYVPPIKIFGVRANLVSLAVERPLLERGPWTLGMRIHGQFGQVRGAYTCPESVTDSEPGSDGNPYGCDETSNDTAKQRYVGAELSGSYRLDALYGLAPYLALGGNYLTDEFHVHATTFGEKDRTHLASDTWTFSLGAGATLPVGERLRLGIGVFYVPLWVTRPPDIFKELDSMVQVRAEVSYRVW